MTHRSMWKARLYLSAMMISLPEMLEQVGIRALPRDCGAQRDFAARAFVIANAL